jgi:hypothetical protein
MHYLIRIELHSTVDYHPLYDALARRKIFKTINANNGTYELPTGTYYFNGISTAEAVRAAAVAACVEAGHPNAAVIVAEASNIVWTGLIKITHRKQG